MTPDFDVYQLSEDYDALREAVRAVAENKIAPYAAEVDRTASFPQAAHDVAAAKSERHDPELSFFSAAAKCYASDVAMRITTDAVQLLGGAGYTEDFPAERMMRDAKITQIYEGTNQIQRLVMARHVLGA